MKKIITHTIEYIYRLEDLLTEGWRQAQTLLRNHEGQCAHNGCMSKAAAGKVYCRRHLHGTR